MYTSTIGQFQETLWTWKIWLWNLCKVEWTWCKKHIQDKIFQSEWYINIRGTGCPIVFTLFNHFLTIFKQPRRRNFYGSAKFLKGTLTSGSVISVISVSCFVALLLDNIILFLLMYDNADFISLKVCAVGWEPNPHLTRYLEKLEQSYRKCGYRVIINKVTLNRYISLSIFIRFWMQETGVGISNTKLMFGSFKKVTTTLWV